MTGDKRTKKQRFYQNSPSGQNKRAQFIMAHPDRRLLDSASAIDFSQLRQPHTQAPTGSTILTAPSPSG